MGRHAAVFAPVIRQLFVAAAEGLGADAFERKLYVIRRVAELAAGADLVIPSFSSRTLVYKGMLTAPQLRGFYPDLSDERLASALALVHSRFSTNTFPSWELAHPYRMVAHNGEINTLRGQRQLDAARASRSSRPSSSAATCEGACPSCGRAAPTPPCSTTCSSCSCSQAARCLTR
jgi:glutamate synthase domain-containing protein 1